MKVSLLFRSWLENRRTRTRSPFLYNHAAKLTLRRFEDRRVLSVSAGVLQNVLSVGIDSGTDSNPQHIDNTNDVLISVDSATDNLLINNHAIDIGGGLFLHAADVTGIVVHDHTSTNNTINLNGVSAANGFTQPGGVNVHITGGSGNDTIMGSAFADVIAVGFGNNSLQGGGGNDFFVFSKGFAIDSVTNTSGTTNTLDLSGIASNVAVNLQTGTATAGTGTINFSATEIGTIIGPAFGKDSFQGLDQTSAWTLGSTQDSYNSGSVTVSFSGFETIYGGAGDDTFNFDGKSSINVHGGAGTNNFDLGNGIHAGHLYSDSTSDTLNYAAYTTNVNINLAAGTATNVAGITGFDNVISGSGNDVLQGGLGNETLNGGSGHDTFILARRTANTSDTDTVIETGGAGTLKFASFTHDLILNLQASGVQTVDPLTGYQVNLQGTFLSVYLGSGNDNVVGNATLGTYINGGAGSNTLTGGAGNDTLVGGMGSLNDVLIGGGGNDTFVLAGSLGSDTVSNTPGTSNTLNLSGVSGAITVDLQTQTITTPSRTIDISGLPLTSIIGNSSGANSYEGLDLKSTWTVSSTQDRYVSGSANISLANFETLYGGSSDDTFNFVSNSSINVHGGAGNNSFNLGNGVHAGNLYGDTGNDTLSYANYTTSVSVNLSTGTATNVASITGIENVTGGKNNDLLIGNSSNNILIGGGGLDILQGGGGNDTLINGYQSDGSGGNSTIEITSPLTVTNGQNITLTANNIIVDADLNTGSSVNSGSVLLTGAVTLDSNVTISTHATGGTDGNVHISSTIDSDGTPRALTIAAGTGNLVVGGAIGGTSVLSSLQISSAGEVDLNGNVLVAGNITQLRSTGNTNFFGGVNSQHGSISITSGGLIFLGDGISKANNIDLMASTTINAAAALDASNGVALASSGTTTLSPAANIMAGSGGVSMNVGQLTTGGNITTASGAIAIAGPIVLTNGVTWSTNSTETGANITVTGTINGTTPQSDDLTLTSGSGNIEITGNIGAATELGHLLITQAHDTTFRGSVIASSYQQVSGNVTTFDARVVTNGTVPSSGTDGFQFSGQSLQFSGGTASLDSTGHDITIAANEITLPTSFVNAIGKTVTIQTLTSGTSIGLEDESQYLNFTNAQLNVIYSLNVVIGSSSNTGGFKIGTDGPVTVHANYTLATAANLVDNGLLSLDVANSLVANVGNNLTLNGGGRISTNAGNLNLNVGNAMNSSGAIVSNSGQTTLGVGGQLNLLSTSLIQSTTGNVTINTGTMTTMCDGPLVMTPGAVINAGSGQVSLTANGDITLGQVTTTNNTANAVAVTSTCAAIINGNGTSAPNIVADSPNALVSLHAVTGVGSSSTPIQTNLTNLNVLNASNQGVAASGGVRINDVNPNGLAIQQINQQGPGAVAVSSQGTMVVTDPSLGGLGIQSESGPISLTAQNSASNLDFRDTIDSHGGDITLKADNSVIIGTPGNGATGQIISSGGNVTVIADNCGGTAGQVFMRDGSVIDVGAGTVSMQAQGDIVLGHVVTTNNTSSAVTLVSHAGSLVNGGDSGAENIEANSVGAITTIQTHTGIGSGTGYASKPQLETKIYEVNIINGSPGGGGTGNASTDINLYEADGLLIQQIVQNNPGAVRVTADQNIILGPIVSQYSPSSLVSIISLQGRILSDGQPGVTDVTAGTLALRAATGIGSNGPISTLVNAVSALNSGSGNVTLNNSTGMSLSLGTVDGLSGVTNLGSALGDIVIANNATISVDAPLTNSSGGKINLQASGKTSDIDVHAQVAATGGHGSVTVQADHNIHLYDVGKSPEIQVQGVGNVTLTAQNKVVFDPSVLVESGTGAIVNVPPLLLNVQTPQLTDLGLAVATGNFGRPGEHNFIITVNWSDGTINTYQFANPGQFTFYHVYHANPDQADPAAPIPIHFQLAQDPHIIVSSQHLNQDTSSVTTTTQTPGTGLTAIVFDTTPPVVYLTIPEPQKFVDVLSQTVVQVSGGSAFRVENVGFDQVASSERILILEILSPDGEVEQQVEFPEAVLDNISEVTSRLPDGHYRFQLQEPGEDRQRLLLEFQVRQGKIVSDGDKPSRPPSSSKTNIDHLMETTPDQPADAEKPENVDSGDSTMLELPTWDYGTSVAVRRAWRQAAQVVTQMASVSSGCATFGSAPA